MGRYYSGDIEGKFWFGVQGSDDASFFGGTQSEPNYIDYYFDERDVPEIMAGIETCKQRLGSNKQKLLAFFADHESYNDKQLADCLGMQLSEPEKCFASPELREILSWYARLLLGEKILTCVEERGECQFNAEL